MIQIVEGKAHQIIKRNGSIEPYNPEKMYKVVLWACENSKPLAEELLKAIDIKIHNKMKIEVLFDEVIATAANKISDLYPIWEKIAKNLYELKLHKEMGYLRDEYPNYDYIFHLNEEAGLISRSWRSLIDLETLSAAINPSYDKLFTFGGLNIFVEKYCNKSKGKLLELPQHAYMRIAIQLMYQDGTEAIIKKYLQLAQHQVTEATPKMVNALRNKASMFSCCINRPSDSQEGINESINMLAKESKYSGGCGWDDSLLRGPGSRVEGNNGSSGGAIPFIQALQWTVGAYNQGNTRSSACISTFDAFNIQSPEKAMLKLESGKDEDRARRLQYSVKWNRHLSKAVKNNEDIYLINPHKAQELFNSFGTEWEELYQKACKNSSVTKRKYNARDLAYRFATTSFETGNLYYFFTDNANEQDIGTGYIPASNLCVTGDTKILTKNGYVPIESVAGTTQECWNGEQWSKTPIFKTSNFKRINLVSLSNGQEIKATDYHKWYIAKQDRFGKLIEYKEVRTNQLQSGDKLIKFNLAPIVHGTKILSNAYENGFYTANGVEVLDTLQRIFLYGKRKNLLPFFSSYASLNENDNKINLHYKNLQKKYFIPNASYRLEDRLSWFAGYLDGNGCIIRNNSTETIQIISTKRSFLREILLFLQELGVQAKVSQVSKAGYKFLPISDNTKKYKKYWHKKDYKYRLTISGSELQHLLSLGFKANRVQPTIRNYNQSTTQFVQVIDVTKTTEKAAVYCGTEPLRHKLMFNGVLTGNCQEMVMSYDPIELVSSELRNDQAVHTFKGDIALCNLASINLTKWFLLSPEEKEDFMYILVKSADNAIENSYYVNPLGEKHSKSHRNLGIGTSNYANLLASQKLFWNSEGARRLTHEVYEEISYYAIKASIQIAKETSRCEVFKHTKWSKGLFPHELSILGKSDSHLNYPLKQNWEALRPELLKYGIRNSRLLAIAPTATSGKAINATEGVDPPRKLKTIQEGTYSLPFVVPNLRENRDYYQTTFEVSNKDIIELAAIRQKFLCMSQSVSLAFDSSKSAFDLVSAIIYAEELGLKTLYYTHTRKATDTVEVCESCGS